MEERIISIIKEITPIPGYKVTKRSFPQKDLGLDMIDLFQLVLMLENEFFIHIPDDDSALFETVGEVQEYVSQKLL